MNSPVTAPTVDDLLAHVEAPSGSDPTKLEPMLQSALGFAESATGWRMGAPAAVVKYYDEGPPSLGLPNQPGLTVTEVAVLDDAGTWEVLESTDWVQVERSLRRVDRAPWGGSPAAWPAERLTGTHRSQAIRVTWTAGFGDGVGETPMPSELHAAILATAAELYRNRHVTNPVDQFPAQAPRSARIPPIAADVFRRCRGGALLV
jgi:hypothetical protein